MLSVITPALNAGRFLPETVASVRALTVPHEHIVVDGGSKDGSVEFLQRQQDPSLRWVSKPDRGQTHAVNRGLDLARGTFIAWLNADDAYVPDTVDRAVGLLASEQGLDAVYGFMEIVDEKGDRTRMRRCGPFSWWRYLYIGGYLPTPTIIFRRSLLDRAPRLNETYSDAADYDFYLRLLRGAKVRRLRLPLVKFRYHRGSKTGSSVVQTQRREVMDIRLGWARTPLERNLMRALRQAQRVRDRVAPPWPPLERDPAPR